MTTWTPAPSRTRHNRVHEFTSDTPSRYNVSPVRTTLDEILGLDAAPVQVNADGTLTSRGDLYAPDVYVECTDDGSSYLPGAVEDAVEALSPWQPLRGHTGQHGSTSESWLMHASEFIGGGMADRILAEPGIYVAVVVYPLAGEGVEVEPTEWAVLRRDITD